MEVLFLHLDLNLLEEDIPACVNVGRGADFVHAERGVQPNMRAIQIDNSSFIALNRWYTLLNEKY